jgi:Recombination endonuclease VII
MLDKQCTACAKEGIGPKPISEFQPARGYRDGFSSWCRTHRVRCSQQWREANPGKSRLSYLKGGFKKRYGITIEQYEALYIAQGRACAICRRPLISQVAAAARVDSKTDKMSTAHVDHCHTTGKVRGLLCSECNTGIGQLQESPAIFRAAIAYIEANSEEPPP